MKTLKTIISILVMSITVNGFSQTLTPKQIERQKSEVKILTDNERNDLQIWFHQELNKLNLSDSVEREYDGILSLYTYKMKRLDDKDQDFTSEQIQEQFHYYITTLNQKVSDLLPQDKYEMHLDIMQKLLNYVSSKQEQLTHS